MSILDLAEELNITVEEDTEIDWRENSKTHSVLFSITSLNHKQRKIKSQTISHSNYLLQSNN